MILVVATVVPAALAQKADTKSVEATITKMEMDSRKADMAGQNGSWMKAHNTDDYTMGTSWGAWEDNAELQKDAADTANNKTTKRDISDIKVSVYGNNTAIARYKESYDMMIKGEHRSAHDPDDGHLGQREGHVEASGVAQFAGGPEDRRLRLFCWGR